MSTGLLWLVVIVFGVAAIIAAAILLGFPLFGGDDASSNVRSHMRNIVATQRAQGSGDGRQSRASIFESAEDVPERRVVSARLTLEKKLKFARWTMPPVVFRALEAFISILAVFFVSRRCNIVMSTMAVMTGPLFMRWLLTLAVERRFKKFDEDFPQFLLSLVGLIKTGMNTMTAIDASAQGLNEDSLVRQEVELMSERLRFGVSEEKSIGSFGEDVYHPEIELFVQALLLSRRVGGTLSDTLDRLAKQVRKRQYFRNSANAAVGMQRGSIWFIIAIMAGMEVYLYLVYPEAVVGAIADDFGWQVWQFGITVILLGIYWVRQVTKIRV